VLLLIRQDLAKLLLTLGQDGASGRLFHVLCIWSFYGFLRVGTHEVVLHVLGVIFINLIDHLARRPTPLAHIQIALVLLQLQFLIS
jgi:hypothetical protein